MAGSRFVGAISTDPFEPCSLNDGTMNRGRTSPPGFTNVAGSIGKMPLEDRFVELLRRTLPHLPSEMREEFALVLSPTNLAIVAGTLAVWAGSHYFGVGFVVDAILVVSGVILLGVQVWQAASDLVAAIRLTASAQTTSELDLAANHLANFIAIVGVTAFLALVFRGAQKGTLKAKSHLVQSAATEAIVDQMLIKLMGSTKNVGTLVRQNVKVLVEYLSRRGIAADKMPEIMRGIDLHSPIRIETLKKGTILTQRVAKETGRWFSKSGVSDRNLGLSSANREYKQFRLTRDVEVIESKAAAIADTWTQGRRLDVYSPNTGQAANGAKLKAGELASGGGTQFFIPEGASVVEEVARTAN